MEWIPIEKTLPFVTGEYLVTFNFGNINMVDIMVFKKKDNKFLWNHAYTRDMTEKILAWMPIPKAYTKD